MRTKIEQTADGSHTLFVPELDEHYHSINGAVQESTHIFINTGLRHCSKKQINVFEIGFGTGLNAYLTALAIQNTSIVIHYTSIEAYPLSLDLVAKLNYPKQIGGQSQDLFFKLHEIDWNNEQKITSNFFLTKVKDDFTKFDTTLLSDIDIVYFDAFAPEKQPCMWSQSIFDRLFAIMSLDSILVTYCAKGVVRRMMQQAGFIVERLPGPPGKREMLRATKKNA